MSQKNMEVMLNMEDKAEAEELTTFLKSVNITKQTLMDTFLKGVKGIETGYGAYEVLSNVFMDIVTDEDGTPKRDVYICMDASLLTTDMNAATQKSIF